MNSILEVKVCYPCLAQQRIFIARSSERKRTIYSSDGQTSSTDESLGENQKQQRPAKSVCSVKHSSSKKASFTQNDLHQIAWTPLATNHTDLCKHIVKWNKHEIWGDNSLLFEILLFSWKSHTKHVGERQFAYHWYSLTSSLAQSFAIWSISSVLDTSKYLWQTKFKSRASIYCSLYISVLVFFWFSVGFLFFGVVTGDIGFY